MEDCEEKYKNLILNGIESEVEKLLINDGINIKGDRKNFFQIKKAVLKILSTFIDRQDPSQYRAIQPLLKLDTNYTEGIDILENKGLIERHPENSKLVRLHKYYFHTSTGIVPPPCKICNNYPRLTSLFF